MNTLKKKTKSHVARLSALAVTLAVMEAGGAMLLLSACSADDSVVAGELVPDITIADFPDEGFTVVSYAGNRLQLAPTVTTTYAESQLSYDWYLIDLTTEGIYHPSTDTDYHFDREHIATGARLDYEVNLTPGKYTLVFEVQADNGYTVSKTASLNAVTNFTQGFYILKETADGQTELDLFNPGDGLFIEDVLTQVHGAPLAGQPQNLSTAVSHSYIDSETNEMTNANLVTVTTTDGQLYAMRSSDLHVVLTRENILYTEMAADEQPYRIVSGYWGNYLVTNRGLRFQYNASLSLSGSGKYGLESEMGASPYIVYDESSGSMFFWDAGSHSVGTCDFNGTTRPVQDSRYSLSGLMRMTTVAVGYSASVGQVLFVLSSTDGSQRQLVQISTATGSAEVQAMRALRVNKINRARLFTVSCASAALLYGVVDNTIMALDLNTYAEQEVHPTALPAEEHIVYLSNQYGGLFGNYDYFVVGTQQGNDYTLRFYNLLGGQPDGEPVITLQGKGTPKALHYTEQVAYSFANTPLQD